MVNHLKSHGQRHNEAVYEEALPVRPSEETQPTCGLVCKSIGGLTTHSKIHRDVPQPVTSNIGKCKYHICERTWKTVAGLKRHPRAHGRAVINEEMAFF